MLRALGCKVVLTEGPKGMKACIARAEEIAGKLGDRAWIPRQFDNPANPAIHYQTTGPEIWADTGGKVDIFVAGVGTGGTITGAGRFLREKKPGIRIVCVEPAESPVISGGAPSPHKQQGIGAGFVPDNLDRKIYDEIVTVTTDDAIATDPAPGARGGHLRRHLLRLHHLGGAAGRRPAGEPREADRVHRLRLRRAVPLQPRLRRAAGRGLLGPGRRYRRLGVRSEPREPSSVVSRARKARPAADISRVRR